MRCLVLEQSTFIMDLSQGCKTVKKRTHLEFKALNHSLAETQRVALQFMPVTRTYVMQM